MEYCPICNIEYSTGTRYCQKCKNQLLFRASPSSINNMDCPQCGKKIPTHSAICPYCHTIIQQNEKTSTPSNFPGKKKKKKKYGGQLSGEELRKKIEKIPIVTITCPKCFSSVLSDFESCPHCGTSLNPSQKESKSISNIPLPSKSPEPQTTDAIEEKPVEEIKTDLKPVRLTHDVTPEPGDEKYLKEAMEEQKILKTREKGKNGKKKIEIIALDSMTNPDTSSPEDELEDKWKTIDCPHCHKPTRTHTGRCLHCGQLLSATGIIDSPDETVLSTKENKDITTQIDEREISPIVSPVDTEPEMKEHVPVSNLEYRDEIIESAESKTKIAVTPRPVSTAARIEPDLEKITPTIPPKRFSPYMLFAIVLMIIIGIGFFIKQQFQSPTSNIDETPLLTEPPVIMSDSDTITLLLDNVRDAMLSQDTILYLSVFSPTMEDLDERQKGLQELWDTYQIQNLQYQINEDNPLIIQDNNAEVIIEWNMNLRRFKDNELIPAQQRNHVKLTKINGQWKIVEVSIR